MQNRCQLPLRGICKSPVGRATAAGEGKSNFGQAVLAKCFQMVARDPGPMLAHAAAAKLFLGNRRRQPSLQGFKTGAVWKAIKA
jgi:hypothetical protein